MDTSITGLFFVPSPKSPPQKILSLTLPDTEISSAQEERELRIDKF